MLVGERQVAPTLDGIRADHVARYRWAALRLRVDGTLLDLACGIGYGAYILAEAGHDVVAVDRDADALDYATKHYVHARIGFYQWTAEALAASASGLGYSAAVCFETIEHIEAPLPMLKALHRAAPLLLASVPNEAVIPWADHPFHFRHYTRDEFEALLTDTGWRVNEWWGQIGKQSPVEPNVEGRTLIAVAVRA